MTLSRPEPTLTMFVSCHIIDFLSDSRDNKIIKRNAIPLGDLFDFFVQRIRQT